MQRSGTLALVAAVLTGALAGCSATAPGPTAPPTTEPPAATRACPPAFLTAFAEDLAARAAGSAYPEVRVVEKPHFVFPLEPLDAATHDGCVVQIERENAAGDIGMQIAGVTSGSDEATVLGILEDAGWTQPFPDTDPWAYQHEFLDSFGRDDIDFVSVYPVDGPDVVFGFEGWAEYFDASEMILQTAPRV